MNQLLSLPSWCVGVMVFSVFCHADSASTPQFAVIQTDKPTYTVGDKAVVSVMALIQPSNPDFDLAVVIKIAGSQVDSIQLSASEWAVVTPPLSPGGSVALEADVYLENKTEAQNLNSTISFFENEIAQLQLQIQNTHDSGTIASLQAQITRDQALVQASLDQLTQIRRLVETDTQSLTVNPPPLAIFQINAGGVSYSGSDGSGWIADEDFAGGAVYSATSTINGTPDPILYQSERYGTHFGYALSAPNGNYSVILKFAENYWTAAGKRIFDVSINGTSVLSRFDIFSAAGGEFIAIDKAFPVAVSSGQISIQFSSSGPGDADNAQINAIRVIPTSRTLEHSGVDEVTAFPRPMASSTPPPSTSLLSIAADHEFDSYKVGDFATFTVHVNSDFSGPEGPKENILQAKIDGQAVSVLQEGINDFAVTTGPFVSAQVGQHQLVATLLVRSKAQADILRNAIDQANARRADFAAKLGSTSDPLEQAYDQSQIDDLTAIISSFYAQLQGALTNVGSGTIGYTVTSSL